MSTKRASAPSAKKTSRRALSDDDLKQVAGGTRTSTKLAQACATGKHIAKAQITS